MGREGGWRVREAEFERRWEEGSVWGVVEAIVAAWTVIDCVEAR